MNLDIEFVRNQFSQIHDDPDFVFCSNAGGSYVANQVNAVMSHYNAHTRVQPYERYPVSDQAGKAMDRAMEGWAMALNIDLDELTIGPSTSMNTYVMAQAIGSGLAPGDEIVVTNQDHEANSGAWRRMAEEKGVTICEWRVDSESGLLDPGSLNSHQSLMYVNREALPELSPQCHYFNTDFSSKWFNPAGPQHAQVASCAGVLDYFDDLHRHHFQTSPSSPDKMAQLHTLISAHESTLTAPILDYLSHNEKVRLIGKNHTGDGDRVPTISFQPLKQSALAVSSKIQDMGIGCESGNFYAYRLLTDLGIDPEDGVVRVSLVHYSSADEVERILEALDAALNS
jgi:selenocysteine lyase/cysteine desulfurase